MKRCIGLKCIAVTMAVIFTICLCFLLLHNKTDESSHQTGQYELEFYTSLLYALNDTKRIYIDDLVPVEWDTMHVFVAYATKDNKVDYAGYIYANDIQDITHEDVISLIFLAEDKVVYYVDTLVPRMFDIERISANEVKLTLNDDISTLVNLGEAEMISSWAYRTEITETHCQNRPYLDVVNKGNGSFFLTIKNERILEP